MTDTARQSEIIALFKKIASFWLPRAIYTVCKMGIPDLIGMEVVSAEEIAKKKGLHPEALYRLLRALSPEGIFIEEPNRTFRLGRLGLLLREDSEYSLKNAALMYGEEVYAAWGDLPGCIKTGESGWAPLFGTGYFDYLEKHSKSHKIFNAAMRELGSSVYSNSFIREAYPIPANSHLVDIGGGTGGLLAELLRGRSDLTGELLELDSVLDEARSELKRQGVEDRVKLTRGDFFQDAPPHADIYILKRVIHDWPDDKALTILKTVKRAMRPGAKLLIIDYVIPSANLPSNAYLVDLHMLVILGGAERSEKEFQELLGAAGFGTVRIIPTEGPLCIIEAGNCG